MAAPRSGRRRKKVKDGGRFFGVFFFFVTPLDTTTGESALAVRAAPLPRVQRACALLVCAARALVWEHWSAAAVWEAGGQPCATGLPG